MNNTPETHNSADCAWDDGVLGRSAEHVVVASAAECKEVDESLGLQPISIRLQKTLISNLKLIAQYHGIAYQPMIRDLLNRFAASEITQIARQLAEEADKQKDEAGGESGPVSEFLERERKRA